MKYFGEYVTFNSVQFSKDLWTVFSKDPNQLQGKELGYYRKIIRDISDLMEKRNTECMQNLVASLKTKGWIGT